MTESAPLLSISARAKMDGIVQRLITRAVGDYGMSAATAPVRAASILSLDDQDFRFELIDRLTGGLLAEPRRILEIGCGSAPFLYSALRRGHAALGIDVDYERIRIAELKIDAFGLPETFRGTARLGDATALDFAAGAFDLITSWAVIEHIPDLESALFESVRVLRPGGFIVFTAPDYRGGFEAHYEMPWPPMAPRSVCERWVMAFDKPPGGIGTFFPITYPRVAAALESLGCRIVNAELTLPLDLETTRLLDVHDQAALERTAEMIKGMGARGTLPLSLRGTTVFHVAARKL
ncbi:MAG: methylase involved in ubiquinone/menaquinone biosynthesis [Candidatus Eremiobacteraeota bacterium]|nr:methylase involved in ubiquinone/menaquinone biosynthesis [Candidatus Eremiobacteraeota bacterium]